MKKLNIYSKKLGKAVDVKAATSKKQSALGWMNSGWSKSGGWCVPPTYN